MIDRTALFETELGTFCSLSKLDVLVVMTYFEDEANQFTRQLLLYSDANVFSDQVIRLFIHCVCFVCLFDQDFFLIP